MNLLLLAALCVSLAYAVDTRRRTHAPTVPPTPMEERMAGVETMLKELKGTFEGLSRQVMLQQFYVEEKVRSDGGSGLKQVRVNSVGTQNYYATAHVGRRFLAIHDHTNYDRTVGMGELLVAMNGVEFRTRHNDYKLRMPSRTNTTYHKTDDIPFPDVPPSVLSKHSVNDQIMELREYFKAFKTQNVTHRNYKPYFKPNLCYLEGAWTTGSQKIDEPFQSDRHSIDAKSWFDLMDKSRFSAYTGSKSVDENFAMLPTMINEVVNGTPHYAQWNYRILCHPLPQDLPLKQLQLRDDLMYRFPARASFDKMASSRAARYHINEKDNDHSCSGRCLMDDIMMTIPGKDNYPANLQDHSFDMTMEDVRFNNHTLLNTGYYHRYFKTLDKGAMGLKSVHRGFSDPNLWVAQTTHPKVAPSSVTSCHGRGKAKVCETWTARYTYALPLEIVFTTPLNRWNPYDVALDQPRNYLTRNNTGHGYLNETGAYNGTNHKGYYYLTPSEFFSNGKPAGPKDPADTAKGGAGILDKHGVMHPLASSGIRIVTPPIQDVGSVRLRHPIMPVHGEGSGVWKELNALKDMTMHMNRYASLFEERPGMLAGNGTDESAVLHYQMVTTFQDPPGEHQHDVYINNEELEELKNRVTLTVTTSEDMGHSHQLQLKWDRRRHYVYIYKCDSLSHCWDGHSNRLNVVN